MERLVELAQQRLPVLLARLDLVELLLHMRRELHVHDVLKALAHEAVDHLAERRRAQVLTLLDDILAVEDCRNGRRVG